MELPHEAEFSIPELCRCRFTELCEPEFREVYVTIGRPIKGAEDVQKSAFTGTRIANDCDQFPFLHLKGQVLKER